MRRARLEALFARFPSLRVTVMGDLFLDRWYEIDRALATPSIETGLTVHHVVRKRSAAGAAGTVLNNLSEMGAAQLKGLSTFPVYAFLDKYLPSAASMPILYVFDHAVMILWFCGVPILIFLSGLQKTDNAVYEAAMVDGASAWQSFWKITIPSLRSFFFLNGVYSVVEISMRASNPIVKLIKDGMFQITRGFGFSAAVSMIYFVIILAAVLILYLLFGREKKDVVVYEKRRPTKS